MSSELFTIPVTIISSDSDALIELALTLSAFGYEVETSSDWSDEAPWRQADRSGILLLDDPAPEQLDLTATNRRSSHFLYCILIQGADRQLAADEADQAAADDVIRRPFNRGELLARLRAGVRRLEFERRCLDRSVVDPESGLLSRAGFVSRVARQDGGRANPPWTLMLLQIHSYRQIRAEHGQSAVRSLAAGLTRAIDKEIGAQAVVFLVKPGVIGVQLVDATLAEATAAAEGVVRRFGSCDTLAREVRCCPSVSAAVVACEGDDADDAVQRCQAALSYAGMLGGGQVVLTQQVEEKLQAWKQEVAGGVLLRDVTAEDAMETFPAVFSISDSDSRGMVDWLRSAARHGSANPASLPVVQEGGQLVGMIDLDRVDEAGELGTSAMVRDAPTVAPEATLAQVLDALFDCGGSGVIVVRDGLPLGYITREALTELFAERVSPLRYYRESANEHCAADLAVPLTPEPSLASPA